MVYFVVVGTNRDEILAINLPYRLVLVVIRNAVTKSRNVRLSVYVVSYCELPLLSIVVSGVARESVMPEPEKYSS